MTVINQYMVFKARSLDELTQAVKVDQNEKRFRELTPLQNQPRRQKGAATQ